MITSDRRSARRAEVERDRQLVTAKLLHDLQHLHGQIAPETDPEHLWQIIDAKLAESRENHRRLTHARISLRGERAVAWDDSRPLPAALACYRHRGNYRGGFRSMAAIGVLLGPCSCLPAVSQPDPVTLVHELHLRAELWTIELGGLVHVFTTPGSCSDEALALLRTSRGPHAAVRAADS